MKILVTGGAGFIGSSFVDLCMEKGHHVAVIDLLTYAGRRDNLARHETASEFEFWKGDVRDRDLMDKLVSTCDCVVHFAAETHVDTSFLEPQSFVDTEMLGTLNVLEVCKTHGKRVVVASTDEVYGQQAEGEQADESSVLKPRNPYSAAKAGADLLCRAYFETFGVDVVIARSANNMGRRQHVEKLVPKVISNALSNNRIPVYGKGLQRRDWLSVDDNCAAIYELLLRGRAGEAYNVSAHQEIENIALVERILTLLEKPRDLVQFVPDRPGHDFRYGMSTAKIEREIGWRPRMALEETLEQTIDWYVNNDWWWRS